MRKPTTTHAPNPFRTLLTTLLMVSVAFLLTSQEPPEGRAQSEGRAPTRDVFMGEPWLEITAENVRGDPPTRYRVLVAGAVYGANQRDTVRLEWKKGRRTLATARCPIDHHKRFDCAITGDALRTTGQHRLLATLIDQNTDEEFAVLDAKPVIETARTMGYQGDGSYHFPVFYVNQDERMGLAYVMNPAPGMLRLFFWRSEDTDESRHPQINVRCKHGDEDEWQGFIARRMISDPRNDRNAQRQLVHVRIHDGSGRNEQRVTRMWWREMVNVQFPAKVDFREDPLDEHVEEGVWNCQYREDGVAVRGFVLDVDGEGRLRMPGAQIGRDGLPFANTSFRVLNLGFLDEATYGESFDGPAMKRSFGFGRPWPKNGEGMEAELRNLPNVRKRFSFPRIPRGIRNGDRARGRGGR